MPMDSPANLVDTLRRCRLLDPPQLAELTPAFLGRFKDARALARELLQRSWLTPYQINQLFQGREADLQLGQYVILERLGEGGMGQVFKARQLRMNRTVALKVIRKDKLANPEAVKRFHREIQAAAQLSHTNVVVAYDADQVGNTHFFAMEYVEGTDLMQMVKQSGPLPVPLACNFIRQAADGLQHAFERGLVHRDIKPSNLLVTWGSSRNVNATAPKGATGQPLVKILDMGLARLDGASDDDTSALTQEGSVMGTLDYLAPEQAQDSRRADIRSDLYSLGCTFCFLLTGQPPFPGGNATEKLLKHRLDQPPPLSRVRQDVPPGVAAVISRLLAKRPEDRFQAPADLAAALAKPLDKIGVGLAPAPAAADNRIVNGERAGAFSAGARSGSAPIALLMPNSAGSPAALPLTMSGEDTLTSGRFRRLVAQPWHRLGWKAKVGAGAAVGLLFLILVILVLPGGRKGSRRSVETLPTPEATSEADLRRLKERLDDYKGEPEGLRKYLLAVHRTHHATPVALQAAELLTQVPSPLDGLDGKSISGDDQALAGSPEGLVAVIGDQRMRHWGLPGSNRGRSVAWLPDGRFVVSAGDDGAARFWDPSTGKQAKLIAAGHPLSFATPVLGGKGVITSSNFGMKMWDVSTGREMPFPPGRFMAISPDGTLAATGPGGGVKVWNLATGQERGGLVSSSRGFWGAGISSDNQLVASSNDDHLIQVWEAASGKVRANLKGHTTWVYTLRFAADAKVLASSDRNGVLKVWDVAAEKELASFPMQQAWGISPDGKVLAITGGDGNVKLWDVAAAKERATLRPEGNLHALVFSPDGHTVATGAMGSGETIRLWDVATGAQRSALRGSHPGVASLAFSADGRSLASISFDGTVKIWDLTSAKELQPNAERSEWCTSCQFSRDGKTLALLYHNSVKLWDTPTGKQRAALTGHQGQIQAWTIGPDDQTLATGSFDRTAKFWDVSSGQPLATVQPGGYGVTSVAIAPDGRTAATAEWGGAKLYDVATGQQRLVFEGPKAGTATVAFAPDGKSLAVGNNDGTVNLHDLTSPKKSPRTFQGLKNAAHVTLTADGRTLLARNTYDGTVKIWDPGSGKELASLPICHAWTVSPDSRTVTTSSGQDGQVRVYDVANGQVKASLEGHTSRVEAVAYSLDGQLIATAGSDGRVIVWDPASRKRKLREWRLPGPVLGVAFAADGRHVATANGNGSVYLLRINAAR